MPSAFKIDSTRQSRIGLTIGRPAQGGAMDDHSGLGLDEGALDGSEIQKIEFRTFKSNEIKLGPRTGRFGVPTEAGGDESSTAGEPNLRSHIRLRPCRERFLKTTGNIFCGLHNSFAHERPDAASFGSDCHGGPWDAPR